MRPRLLSKAGFALAAVSAGLALRRRLKGRLRLRGSVVVVTGGSRGLGLALARALAMHGAHTVLFARDAGELAAAEAELTGIGQDASVRVCDVSDVEQVERAVGSVLDEFGRVDVLINNAGIIQVGPALSMELGDYEKSLDVNFWGVVHATRAVLPQMLERRRGAIVNITSIGGKVSVPHLLPYSAAKFAMVGFSEGLHVEMAREGIHVLTVVPGLMQTGSHIQAEFKGKSEHEYAWFAAAANAPGLAMPADEAADRILEALRQRRSEVILGLPAKLLVRAHGLLPGLTLGVMRWANRLLPRSRRTGEGIQGSEIQGERHSGVYGVLERAGRPNVQRYQRTSSSSASAAD